MDANIESALRKCATDWPASATTIRAYIDALAAERDALREDKERLQAYWRVVADELEAECARLRERWDWMAKHADPVLTVTYETADTPSLRRTHTSHISYGTWPELAQHLDAAIDQARQQGKA